MPRRWVPWDDDQQAKTSFRHHLQDERQLARLKHSADKFFERPYWRRLWVLQELVLARETFVAYGADLIL